MAETITDEEVKEVADDAKKLADRIRQILASEDHSSMAVKIALAEIVASFCAIKEKLGAGTAANAAEDFHELVKTIIPKLIWITKQ